MGEVEIGSGKQARRGYSLDDILVVPSRRTRDPEDIDLSWSVEAYKFALPFLAAASDAVVSPAAAAEIGKLGGLAVLNLEGLWTRYEDPAPVLERISTTPLSESTRCLQEAYAEPIKESLVRDRIKEVAASGVPTCAALSPQRTAQFGKAVVEAELDLLVIQGTVVSAEHVSRSSEPLDLKRFIRQYEIPVVVGGCASYPTALHLMRTGAVGVLVGVGTGSTSTSRRVLGLGAPHATALADVAGARSRHLEETGVYVHVIADGGMSTGGDVTKAIACGADAVMIGSPLAAASSAPGRGRYWEMTAAHERLPRGEVFDTPAVASMEEILLGPSHEASGALNLFGSLRAAMAMCGYASVREFHKAEVVVAG
jgi:IMP dehydrogenase